MDRTKEALHFLIMRYPHGGTRREIEDFFEVYERVVAYPILSNYSFPRKKE